MKWLFELGSDINATNIDGITPFMNILHIIKESNDPIDRDIAELHIYQNPDIDRHKSIFSHAILADQYAYKPETDLVFAADSVSYKMDGKLHGMFGHDENEFRLNFIVPLLLECGFSISDDEIQQVFGAREEESFQPG